MSQRASKKRDRILELVRSTRCHPTAEWVYTQLKQEFPHISLGTVYRNLRNLADSGVILSLESDDPSTHFDGCTRPHAHLTCRDCGNVFDLPTDVALPTAKESDGFLITSCSVMFHGLCPTCRKRTAE